MRRGKILEYAYPTREKIDGQDALVFKGGQYVSLPIGIVPAFGSYEIEMDIYVEKEGNRVQTLMTGTHQSFTLYLRDRVPVIQIYCNNLPGALRRASGPRLLPWKWNKVKFRFDQHKLQVTVNGVAGEAVEAYGFQRYPRATALGAAETGSFFKGKIRGLQITPR